MVALLAGNFTDKAGRPVCKKPQALTLYHYEDKGENGVLLFLAPLDGETGQPKKIDTRYFYTDQSPADYNFQIGDKIDYKLVLDRERRVTRRNSDFYGPLNVIEISKSYSPKVARLKKVRKPHTP